MVRRAPRCKQYKLYIEGGGPGDDGTFRKSWRQFLEAAQIPGGHFTIVRGKTRTDAFRDFQQALADRRLEDIPILIVDAEGPLRHTGRPWAHLKENREDKWAKPDDAADDQAYLMVQCMETWLIADRDNLVRFFGEKKFKVGGLPNHTNLEDAGKKAVLDGLDDATRACGPNMRYRKGDISFKLLATTDPAKVEQRCADAKRLFARLRVPPSQLTA